MTVQGVGLFLELDPLVRPPVLSSGQSGGTHFPGMSFFPGIKSLPRCRPTRSHFFELLISLELRPAISSSILAVLSQSPPQVEQLHQRAFNPLDQAKHPDESPETFRVCWGRNNVQKSSHQRPRLRTRQIAWQDKDRSRSGRDSDR